MTRAPIPGGRPRIPRARPSLPVLTYGAFGALVLVLYLTASARGWSLGEEQRDTLPASVRQAPGGYRAYHFWHSGYQGGK